MKEETRQWPEDHRIYLSFWDDLTISTNGLLCRKVSDEIGDAVHLRPCIPEAEHDAFMTHVHRLGAHQGIRNTCRRALRTAFLPHAMAVATRVVQRCEECAQKDHGNAAQKHTLFSVQDSYPFQRISIDFVGPLRASSSGNRWILTIKDTFSRWVEAYPIPVATAKVVVEHLEKEIFCRFGVPETIHSDRGTQFVGRLLREVADELGITLTNTPAYNPKSNTVERAHRDLGLMLRAILAEGDQNQWELVLPQALFALRTSPSETTGLAPYQVLFGRHAATPLDHLFGLPPRVAPTATNYPEYVQQLRQRIDAAHRYARQHIKGAVQRRRGNYHARKNLFQPGDWVWLFTPRTTLGESRKLTRYWTGPWEVVERINDLVVKIQPTGSWAFNRGPEVVSIDRLKPHSGKGKIEPQAQDELGMPGDEFAVGPFWSQEGAVAPVPPEDRDNEDEGPEPSEPDVKDEPEDPPEEEYLPPPQPDDGGGNASDEGGEADSQPTNEDGSWPPEVRDDLGASAGVTTGARPKQRVARPAADPPYRPPRKQATDTIAPRPRLPRAAKSASRYGDSTGIPQWPLTRDETWLVNAKSREQLARDLFRAATGSSPRSPESPSPPPTVRPAPKTSRSQLVWKQVEDAKARFKAATRGQPSRVQPSRAAKAEAPKPRWR